MSGFIRMSLGFVITLAISVLRIASHNPMGVAAERKTPYIDMKTEREREQEREQEREREIERENVRCSMKGTAPLQ